MKLNNIFNEMLNEYQNHKIRVGEIFLNDNIHGDGINSGISRITNVYKDDETFEQEPVLDVPVNAIVPTQRFVSMSNLDSVKGNLKDDNTGAYLVKYNNMYYVIDGHHRIANRILRGDTSIKAYVHVIH
jgi:uncharacterized protein (DUF1015 family)